METNDEVLSDILQDEMVETPPESELEELSKLIKFMQLKQVQAELKAKELAIINEEIRVLSQVKIPEKFFQLRLQELKMDDGSKVTITKTYTASMTTEAFTWLRENELDDIIKHEVKLNFGRGEDEQAAVLITALRDQGYTVEEKSTVHPQTLKAFVREQMEIGNPEFKPAIFNVFTVDQTKIKGGK